MFERQKTPNSTIDAIAKLLPTGDELGRFTSALNFTQSRKEDKSRAVYDQYAPAILKALGDDADSLLADVFTDPARYEVDWREQREQGRICQAAAFFAGVHLRLNPTEYAATQLITRLKLMLDFAPGTVEGQYRKFWSSSAEYVFLFPGPSECLFALSAHNGLAATDAFFDEFLVGNLNRTVDFQDDQNDTYDLLFSKFGLLRRVLDATLRYRHDNDRLSYEFFRDAINTFAVFERYPQSEDNSEEKGDEYIAAYRNYGQRFITDTVDALPETADIFCRALGRSGSFRGIHWIGRGLDKIRELGYKAKDLRPDYDDAPDAIKNLLSGRLDEDETEEELIVKLKEYDEATLLLALPHAQHARVAILKALGWDDIIAVQDMIFSAAGGTPYCGGFSDIPNGEDPNSGVLDREQWLAVLNAADEVPLKKYIKVMRAWGAVRKTMTLVDALRGKGREKVDRALKKHGQIATKALGLFPAESDDDVRERYLILKKVHKEVSKYGSERQANSRAAVQSGMRNLAQAAGYPDEVRMEWELESDLADSMTGLDNWHEIEQWKVRLELEGISAMIRIEKNGKLLKSVPPKVRKTDYYKQLRENQDILRAQARRFRKSLENMMCTGEQIDAKLLALLKKHPALRAMMKQLILVNADGAIGLFDDELESLHGLSGASAKPSLPLRIAHVCDLYKADQLAGWQEAVVGRHMVQPFKQAFRELYLLTPAEESAGTQSTRFIGHMVNSGVTGRLLQSRNWRPDYNNSAFAHKHCEKHNVTAYLVFDEYVRFFLEQPELTMSVIEFKRGNDYVEMIDVDPLLFSETMRDADLVASVAQASDDEGYGRFSAEVLAQRSAVLNALLQDIGLDRVTCREKFAHVKGNLASYRVHLASGAIHIEPGNYLCIVPEGVNKTANVYLPFADTDRKMSEILSKVLLLINDDQITDTTILSQINRATETASA